MKAVRQWGPTPGHVLDHTYLLQMPISPIERIYMCTKGRPKVAVETARLILEHTHDVPLTVYRSEPADFPSTALMSPRLTVSGPPFWNPGAELGGHPFDAGVAGLVIGDLVYKRMQMLEDASSQGLNKILCIDDEIRGIVQGTLGVMAAALDHGGLAGSLLEGKPDNSKFSRVIRTYSKESEVWKMLHPGGRPTMSPDQNVFLSGGFMGIHISKLTAMVKRLEAACKRPLATLLFPSIYNDDWIMASDAVAEGEAVGVRTGVHQINLNAGHHTQLSDPTVAAAQEPGEIVAEYLYSTLHYPWRYYNNREDLHDISSYLTRRMKLQGALLRVAERRGDVPALEVVTAASDVTRKTTPESVADYLHHLAGVAATTRDSLTMMRKHARPVDSWKARSKPTRALHSETRAVRTNVSDVSKVHSSADVGAQGYVGQYASVGAGAVIGDVSRLDVMRTIVEPLAVVDRGAMLEPGALVATGGRVGAGALVEKGSVVANGGFVDRGSRVLQGSLVFGYVGPGVTVGPFAYIAPGVSVMCDMGANTYAGGGERR